METASSDRGNRPLEGGGKSPTEKQRSWLAHIKRCDSGDDSYASYCARHGLKAKALYAARKLLHSRGYLSKANKRVPQPARFAPVRLAQMIDARRVDIALANGGRLTWCAPDAASVAELVILLNRPSKCFARRAVASRCMCASNR